VSASATSASGSVDRERRAAVGTLLVAAAALWVLVAWLANGMADDEEAMLTMGMGGPLFVATWAAMMAAMMLPTVSPMVDAFVRIQAAKRASGNGAVPVSVFLAGYLAVWVAVGVPAFLGARFLEDAAMDHQWLMDGAARFGGALIVAAGIYQLTPLKRVCLHRCRTPMSFIVTSWRDGRLGALRMGVVHGGYCLGCCWLLFALLFPLGLMNVAIMAAVAAVVFAEKALPAGEAVAVVAAIALLSYGVAVLMQPGLLPALM
jgi:predicted metal-binding membrane protein